MSQQSGIPTNESFDSNLFWVGNNNGYPSGLLNQSTGLLNNFTSTNHWMDVNMSKSSIYTSQTKSVQIDLKQWNPNTTSLDSPLTHSEAVGFRVLVDEAIAADKSSQFTPISVGEQIKSSWGCLWLKAKVSIPSRHFIDGRCIPKTSQVEPLLMDTPVYRNRTNELQLFYDFGGEAVIFVPQRALDIRENWTTIMQYHNSQSQFPNHNQSQPPISPTSPLSNYLQSTLHLPKMDTYTANDDSFAIAQGFAAQSGSDRRVAYPLFYYMADNFDPGHPEDLPATLEFTFYIQNHFNHLFGNSVMDDSICPPSPVRNYTLNQFDVLHVNAVLQEVYYDFVVCRDIGVQFSTTTFGQQAIRLCHYIIQHLLASKSRSFLVSNLNMRDQYSRYQHDGDVIDVNNPNLKINVYNAMYDDLYKQCSRLFSLFLDGGDPSGIKHANRTLLAPTTTVPGQIMQGLVKKHRNLMMQDDIIGFANDKLIQVNKTGEKQLSPDDRSEFTPSITMQSPIIPSFPISNVPLVEHSATSTNPNSAPPTTSTLPQSTPHTNTVVICGHAHIDVTWLWTFAQTRAKVVSSWSNQLSIAHDTHHHNFAFSSALQMKWLKEDHPSVFSILQRHVAESDDFKLLPLAQLVGYQTGGNSASLVFGNAQPALSSKTSLQTSNISHAHAAPLSKTALHTLNSSHFLKNNRLHSITTSSASMTANPPHVIMPAQRKGGFYPVGGSYLENDTNMPSLEHLIRQFVIGQRYLLRYFNRHSRIFWLPDTFGYSVALPQVLAQCDVDYFMTQKLSWNAINKPSHNTFYWQGLDGTKVLTTFPPTDTYNCDLELETVQYHQSHNKDAALSNTSLMLVGFGDGGGGPLPHQSRELGPRISAFGLAAARGNSSTFNNFGQSDNIFTLRLDNNKAAHPLLALPNNSALAYFAEPIPSIPNTNAQTNPQLASKPANSDDSKPTFPTLPTSITSPSPSISPLPQFLYTDPESMFAMLEQNKNNYNTISGELYLEIHRATFVSHKMIKTGNALAQTMIYQAELYLMLLYVKTVALFYNHNGVQKQTADDIVLEMIKNCPGIVHDAGYDYLYSIAYDLIWEKVQKTTDFITYAFILSRQAWEMITLNAFHDALPGSSINLANHDITQLYAQCVGISTYLIRECLTKLSEILGANSTKGKHIAVPTTFVKKTMVAQVQPQIGHRSPSTSLFDTQSTLATIPQVQGNDTQLQQTESEVVENVSANDDTIANTDQPHAEYDASVSSDSYALVSYYQDSALDNSGNSTPPVKTNATIPATTNSASEALPEPNPAEPADSLQQLSPEQSTEQPTTTADATNNGLSGAIAPNKVTYDIEVEIDNQARSESKLSNSTELSLSPTSPSDLHKSLTPLQKSQTLLQHSRDMLEECLNSIDFDLNAFVDPSTPSTPSPLSLSTMLPDGADGAPNSCLVSKSTQKQSGSTDLHADDLQVYYIHNPLPIDRIEWVLVPKLTIFRDAIVNKQQPSQSPSTAHSLQSKKLSADPSVDNLYFTNAPTHIWAPQQTRDQFFYSHFRGQQPWSNQGNNMTANTIPTTFDNKPVYPSLHNMIYNHYFPTHTFSTSMEMCVDYFTFHVQTDEIIANSVDYFLTFDHNDAQNMPLSMFQRALKYGVGVEKTDPKDVRPKMTKNGIFDQFYELHSRFMRSNYLDTLPSRHQPPSTSPIDPNATYTCADDIQRTSVLYFAPLYTNPTNTWVDPRPAALRLGPTNNPSVSTKSIEIAVEAVESEVNSNSKTQMQQFFSKSDLKAKYTADSDTLLGSKRANAVGLWYNNNANEDVNLAEIPFLSFSNSGHFMFDLFINRLIAKIDAEWVDVENEISPMSPPRTSTKEDNATVPARFFKYCSTDGYIVLDDPSSAFQLLKVVVPATGYTRVTLTKNRQDVIGPCQCSGRTSGADSSHQVYQVGTAIVASQNCCSLESRPDVISSHPASPTDHPDARDISEDTNEESGESTDQGDDEEGDDDFEHIELTKSNTSTFATLARPALSNTLSTQPPHHARSGNSIGIEQHQCCRKRTNVVVRPHLQQNIPSDKVYMSIETVLVLPASIINTAVDVGFLDKTSQKQPHADQFGDFFSQNTTFNPISQLGGYMQTSTSQNAHDLTPSDSDTVGSPYLAFEPTTGRVGFTKPNASRTIGQAKATASPASDAFLKSTSLDDPLQIQVLVIENNLVRYELLQNGRILRAFDKRTQPVAAKASSAQSLLSSQTIFPLHTPHLATATLYNFTTGDSNTGNDQLHNEIIQESYLDGARSLYTQPHPSVFASHIRCFQQDVISGNQQNSRDYQNLEIAETMPYGTSASQAINTNVVLTDIKRQKARRQASASNKVVVNTNPVYISDALFSTIRTREQLSVNQSTALTTPSIAEDLPSALPLDLCGANMLYLHTDMPNYWDGWDVDVYCTHNMYSMKANYFEANSVTQDSFARTPSNWVNSKKSTQLSTSTKQKKSHRLKQTQIAHQLCESGHVSVSNGMSVRVVERDVEDGWDCIEGVNLVDDVNDSLYEIAFIKVYYHWYNEPIVPKSATQQPNTPSQADPFTLHPLHSYTFSTTASTASQSSSFYHHVVQTINLLPDSNTLKFELLIDNASSQHKMLRTSFPAHLNSQSHALFETQGGYIERQCTMTNNSHQIAQFEVCGQKWSAIQEANSGSSTIGAAVTANPTLASQLTIALHTVALHGFSASHNVLIVSLLRSPKRPDNYTDNHIHKIIYQVGSYFPSLGTSAQTTQSSSYRAALQSSVLSQITQHAMLLQSPLILQPSLSQVKAMLPTASFLSTTNPNVIIHAAKLAENSINSLLSHVIMQQGKKAQSTNSLHPFFAHVNAIRQDEGLANPPANPLWTHLATKNIDFNADAHQQQAHTAASKTVISHPSSLSMFGKLSVLDFTNTIAIRVVEHIGVATQGSIVFDATFFDLSKATIYESNCLEYTNTYQQQHPVQITKSADGKQYFVPYTLNAFQIQTFVIHLTGK